MAVVAEYTSNDDNADYSAHCGAEGRAIGQIFTAAVTATIDTLRLRLYKSAGATSSFSVYLVPLSGETPYDPGSVDFNNTALASSFGDTDDLGTDTSGAWVSFDVSGDGASLVSGTQYAIVVTYGNCSGEQVLWRQDVTSPTYSGGKAIAYTYGSEWSDYVSPVDCMFGVDGELVFTPPAGKPTTKRLIAVAENALWYEDV